MDAPDYRRVRRASGYTYVPTGDGVSAWMDRRDWTGHQTVRRRLRSRGTNARTYAVAGFGPLARTLRDLYEEETGVNLSLRAFIAASGRETRRSDGTRFGRNISIATVDDILTLYEMDAPRREAQRERMVRIRAGLCIRPCTVRGRSYTHLRCALKAGHGGEHEAANGFHWWDDSPWWGD